MSGGEKGGMRWGMRGRQRACAAGSEEESYRVGVGEKQAGEKALGGERASMRVGE